MERSPIARLSAAALGLGGLAGAGFVIVSRGEIVGAMAMLSGRWMVAHNLHFVSAALLLFGLVGLYMAHAARLSVYGHFAFVVALMGNAFFFALGVVTAAILPFIAGAAPNVVSINGPFFRPPLPVLVVSVAVFSIGWIAVGAALARGGIVPAWAGWTIALGALIQAIPPVPFGPVPWMVTDIGWSILAIGLLGVAVDGWRMTTPTLAPSVTS